MFIIIPLGGLGTRFTKYDYRKPKPLIDVLGNPIIYWLLDSLNVNANNIQGVVIPYNNELIKYNFEEQIKKKFPEISFIFIPLIENTNGASETVLFALNILTDMNIIDCPILSLDGDNFYLIDIIKLWNGNNSVITFEDHTSDSLYSFIKTNDNNEIIDIIEKRKISNFACSGAYGFNSWVNLKKYCEYVISNKIKQEGEYYMSNVIKEMIKDSVVINNILINKHSYICLGTPLQVRIFCNNYPKKNIYNNNNSKFYEKRFCFDLDNTLVSYPKIDGDYTTVEPIKQNINFLRYLKKMGNIIIIHTARRMKTHGGNTGKLLKDIGKITFDTLDKFNIPYDEIYFGKPEADFYIDDKAINAFGNLEKETGFYIQSITPRDFNNINDYKIIETLKKSSNDLSGEIYYYNNISNEIKDIFPFFLNYDSSEYKWYEIEKINGIPLSIIYINGELNERILDSVIGTLKRIHESKINIFDNNIESLNSEGHQSEVVNLESRHETSHSTTRPVNIYANYINKLKERYNSYDYSIYNGADKIYNRFLDKLHEYEYNNKGMKCVIHGDMVFTNIIINDYGKIKLIDPRGKIGSTLSNQGDILYDYAKLYQSLIGYDAILLEKDVDLIYKQSLINYFKHRFTEMFNEEYWEYLQYITGSLLFSLIPLHDNDKCNKYFDLIKTFI